ncbi:MAG: hypothetical protein PGN07_07575 [Aeromicrobium erythreum]
MPRAEYDASPREVRTFALLQVGLTTGFLVLLFFALDGLDADVPPWWLIAVLLLAVAASAFLAERVWLDTEPLDPDLDPEDARAAAVGVYASQTVRRLWICNASIAFAIIVAFVANNAAWPLVIGGLPGLALMTWEVWPSLRNLSMTEVVLDDDGATSGLVESFRDW